MKRWLVSELFYPVETSTGFLMTSIAKKLITDGKELNVITGPANYDSSKLLSGDNNLDNKIIIHRASVPDLNKNSLIQRAVKMLLLSFKIIFLLFRKVKKGDRVFVVTNPAPILIFVAIAKKIKKFELILIVHDVFPENMLPGKMIKESSLFYKLLRKIFNASYRAADKAITLGEDMNNLIINKTNFSKEKTEIITNWADCDEIFPLNFSPNEISEYYGIPELKDKIIIQFAGNIGRLQALPDFLDIFEKANNKDLALVFIGDGAMKPVLLNTVSNKELKHVYFIESKSRDDQNRFLNASHIGLVTLNKGMYGLGVPSKTYNIWAAGKPVIFVGDEGSEIYNNIKSDGSGWAFTWEERDELISFLGELKIDSIGDKIAAKGNIAYQTAVANFDRDVILKKYEQF